MHARVIVLAGPSGSGKSRLARRLALPVLNLDDFYKDGDDPTLPRLPMGVVDWDHATSWRQQDALAAVVALCRQGVAEVPVYDLARDTRVDTRTLRLGGAPFVVAEGIFADQIVPECRSQGLLADAVCVRHHRVVTFWRRLTRDLRERRKSPALLLRRGLLLYRTEPHVVARAVAAGCVPMTPDQALRRLRRVVGSAARPGAPPRPRT